jgi:hypothetical protein
MIGVDGVIIGVLGKGIMFIGMVYCDVCKGVGNHIMG